MKPRMRPEEIIAASRELVEVDHYFERAFKGSRTKLLISRLPQALAPHGFRVFDNSGRHTLPEGFLDRVPAERRAAVEEYARKLFENARKAGSTGGPQSVQTRVTPFGHVYYKHEIKLGEEEVTGTAEPDNLFGAVAEVAADENMPRTLRAQKKGLPREHLRIQLIATRHEQEHMRQIFYDTIHQQRKTKMNRLLKELGATTADKRNENAVQNAKYDLDVTGIPRIRGFFFRRKYTDLVERVMRLKPDLSERQRRIFAKAIYHHEVTTLRDAEKIIEFVERNPHALELRR